MELVDTRDLKSLDRNIVPVQVRPRVPFSLTMKYWHVATYKLNEIKRVETNLLNQKFDYYLPKITTKKINSSPKEEALFPGYVFIHASLDKYTKIKYTKGISKVIRFNNNVAILEDEEINQLRVLEKESLTKPIVQKVFIGQEAVMSDGPFKGSIITIASLPEKERVNIFIDILGSKRKASAPLNEINLS